MTSTTYFISDTHFCHKNIIKYCNRPWKSGLDADGMQVPTDEDTAEMNEHMIQQWNATVPKDGIVWHLGDFCLGKKEDIKKIVRRLNGRIFLVLGNHDHEKPRFYEDAGFARAYDRPVVINNFVILSHAPLQFLNSNCPFYNIFGHVHDTDMYKTWTKSSCCAYVERHGYKPISWMEIQKKYEEMNND